jgi:N-acyl homoserine lactone hydrolase
VSTRARSLTIHPLCVGLFGGPVDSGRDAAADPVSAMFMFLVLGGEHPILVDTGTLDPEAARVRQHRILHRPSEMEPLAALRALGLAATDIGTVVNTHLHWDHSSGNDLFPQARVLVQRAEIAHAVSPAEHHRVFYDKLPGVRPQWLSGWDRVEAVDGDADVVPGVSVIALPGHTPGSQGVLVNTRTGPHLIAGDTVNRYEDWHVPPGQARRPPALLTDETQWRQSAAQIEALHCEVIPSHDLALVHHAPFGT